MLAPVCAACASLFLAPLPCFVDSLNNMIRIVTWPEGFVTTIAGNDATPLLPRDGPGLLASLFFPYHIVQDASGDLFWGDALWARTRRMTIGTWVVATVLGTGQAGYSNGDASTALINKQYGIAVSRNGTLFIAEGAGLSTFNGVRSVVCAATPSQSPSPGSSPSQTATGTPPRTPTPTPSPTAPSPNSCTVTTIAGFGGLIGNIDGQGTSAMFREPTGICADGAGKLIVADRLNGRLRVVDPNSGIVSTLAGGAGGATSGLFIDANGPTGGFREPVSVAMDATGAFIFVADYGSHTIRRVSYPQGAVSTLAGTGSIGVADGLWSISSFFSPRGVAVGPSGAVLVADTFNNKCAHCVNWRSERALAPSLPLLTLNPPWLPAESASLPAGLCQL